MCDIRPFLLTNIAWKLLKIDEKSFEFGTEFDQVHSPAPKRNEMPPADQLICLVVLIVPLIYPSLQFYSYDLLKVQKMISQIC